MISVLKNKIFLYGKMIKFSHTIFAMPFALSAVIMAWRDNPPQISDLLWILAAMAGARSAAMGFNRITDAALDEKKPQNRDQGNSIGPYEPKRSGFICLCIFFSVYFSRGHARQSMLLALPFQYWDVFFFIHTPRPSQSIATSTLDLQSPLPLPVPGLPSQAHYL